LLTTPAVSRRIEEIRFSADQNIELGVIEAGKFTSPDSGKTVLYAREVIGDELHDVFLQSQQGERVIAILAARGRRVTDPGTGEMSFVLYDGRRYEACPARRVFVIEFDEHGIPIRTEEDTEFVEGAAGAGAAAIDVAPIVPSCRRVSLPLSLLVLASGGAVESVVAAEGRYARLSIALHLHYLRT
jgi:hypothetical protein